MVELPEGFKPRDPFSDAQIAEIEQLTGYSLPGDYRSFVGKHGPAYPVGEDRVVEVEWRRIDMLPLGEEEKSEFETLYMFYGLFPADQVKQRYERIHMNESNTPIVLPRHYLPIGHDTGGLLYLLDLSDGLAGSIWAWGQNLSDTWGTDINSYIGFVADDLDDLLHNRVKEPPDDW